MNRARKRYRANDTDVQDQEKVNIDDYIELNGVRCDKETCLLLAKNALAFIGHGLDNLQEKMQKMSKDEKASIKAVQLAIFGLSETKPFNHQPKVFDYSDFRSLGLSKNQAGSRLRRMTERPTAVPKAVRDDSHKSPAQTERNEIVRRILYDDEVSIISDRAEDYRLVNGERQNLRFLLHSVEKSYLLVKEKCPFDLSESLFRNILLKFPEIKTNRRVRSTALCEKCVESNNIERAFQVFGTDELVTELNSADGVYHWFDLWYCRQKSENCFDHTCRQCGRGKKLDMFKQRIGWNHLSEESKTSNIAFQHWIKVDKVVTPENIVNMQH